MMSSCIPALQYDQLFEAHPSARLAMFLPNVALRQKLSGRPQTHLQLTVIPHATTVTTDLPHTKSTREFIDLFNLSG